MVRGSEQGDWEEVKCDPELDERGEDSERKWGRDWLQVQYQAMLG